MHPFSMTSLIREAPIISGLSLVVLPLLTYIIYQTFLSPLAKIPGPFLARYTNLWAFIKVAQAQNHILWQDLHHQYGPLVRTGPNRVTFSDPEVLQKVYGAGSQFLKSEFYNSFQGNLNDGTKQAFPHPSKANLFSTLDPVYHKRIKAVVAPAYSLSSLKPLEPLVDECTDLLITQLKKLSGQTFVDLDNWIDLFAFDAIGMITYLKSFGFLKHGADQIGVSALFTGFYYASPVGMMPWLHGWLLGNDTLLRFLSNFEAFRENNPALKVRDITFQAMTSPSPTPHPHRSDFHAHLRQIQTLHPEKFSDLDLVDTLMINIFAGADTTSITLRAVLYHLLKNPTPHARLRAEIDQADAARKFSPFVSFAQGNDLPYLRAVLKESGRLFPAVPMPLERVVPAGGLVLPAARGEEGGIYHLPAGTRIGAAPSVTNTLPTVFGDDARMFRPERWLESSPEQLARMERCWLTFGMGSRICVGRHISTMELTKVVPQLLRTFDMEWAGGKDEEWTVQGLWFAKQSGLKVRLRVR